MERGINVRKPRSHQSRRCPTRLGGNREFIQGRRVARSLYDSSGAVSLVPTFHLTYLDLKCYKKDLKLPTSRNSHPCEQRKSDQRSDPQNITFILSPTNGATVNIAEEMMDSTLAKFLFCESDSWFNIASETDGFQVLKESKSCLPTAKNHEISSTRRPDLGRIGKALNNLRPFSVLV
jgi:hypothetical protein